MAIGNVRVEPAPGRRTGLRVRELLDHERFLGPAFVTPALLLLVLLVAYPFGMAVWFALSNSFIGRPGEFIGLQNFVTLWSSDSFRQTFQNAFVFTSIAVVFKVVLGIALALLLNEQLWFKRMIRGAVLDTWYRYPEPGNATVRPSRHPFHHLDNVVMTPHLSGWTEGLMERRFAVIIDNIERLREGRPLLNQVHPRAE